MEISGLQKRNFWGKPEGITGGLILAGMITGVGYLFVKFLPTLIQLTSNLLYLGGMLLVLGAILYIILDPRMRNLVWYMYKSVMRWITGLFIQLDPIGILKSYVSDLKDNLGKMNKQIGRLRAQMHLLKEQIYNNDKQIDSNLSQVKEARQVNQESVVVLKARQAGRLKESNVKLEDLYRKMEILYKVLTRMYQASEIMAEDISDQVKIKEQERQAIHASHSAMRSAMSVISGDKDQRALFDEALDAMADDVSMKVGEMEQFMELSENFMSSVDLQNGVFEEKGLKMLVKWEKQGVSKILGAEKNSLVAQDPPLVLEHNTPGRSIIDNPYDKLFKD